MLEDMEHDRDAPALEETAHVLRDALAAADIKRLVRASREGDGDEVERIRQRYVDG
ncbi:hypothetical protein [Nocardiopsis algeriensis]|uniref:Uncharacterized protein n=1 Tax=Nocardiopsis algeriensis TaxID=1478215 RepID=A0A841IVB9_9ACTN|nr:hypothetical protein [Nocardiopsis algeriensis]MBB6121206.1 hypothetical protein [Nocardiopsis algeriensis]